MLQINQSRNRNYADVCPLLDIPHFGQSYLQPVQVSRNIELVTRNLPPEVGSLFSTIKVKLSSCSHEYMYQL